MVFVDAFGVERIRAVFLNISPALMDYLNGGRPALVTAALLVVGSAIAGVAGAVYRTLPDAVRRPLGSAVSVTLLFGFLQRIIPIALDQLDIERDWLYSKVTRWADVGGGDRDRRGCGERLDASSSGRATRSGPPSRAGVRASPMGHDSRRSPSC